MPVSHSTLHAEASLEEVQQNLGNIRSALEEEKHVLSFLEKWEH